MTSSRVSAVLWDLDGTIVDSFELLFGAYGHAVRTVLGWELTRERLAADLGPPMPDHVAKYSPDHVPELTEAFRHYYDEHHDEQIVVHEGVREALAALREREVALGLVTSRGGFNTHCRLESLGLLDCFDAIVTREDAPRPKPDPGPVEVALGWLQVPPGQALMVGDDPVDIEAAKAAGVGAVAALWGARDREALLGCGPCYAAEEPAEVVGLALGAGVR